ncbi:DUF2834 domain-containing protein [Burkholderia alba]|uniref:DUF2834 domain-containing protein n=1 Tax=Burkholderia alba TaxID=2683677 RepID=UPI002B05DAD6|nr:DUF2834 domain-containing protein [Burkholderia alba]
MPISRKMLCAAYGLIALLALIGTWGNTLLDLPPGFLRSGPRFLLDTMATPASRSITVDIGLLAVALFLWLLLEARRLALRGAWRYIALSIVVAISAAFPLCLIHREYGLAARNGAAPETSNLRAGDLAGLLLIALLVIGYGVAALRGA